MIFPERYRYTADHRCFANPAGMTAAGDSWGMFLVPARHAPHGRALVVVADAGGITGWEHASVSIAEKPRRIPSWDEMCFVKAQFWTDDQCAVQYHPPCNDYVNRHPGVLHLWRPLNACIPMPPKACV